MASVRLFSAKQQEALERRMAETRRKRREQAERDETALEDAHWRGEHDGHPHRDCPCC